MSLFDLPELSLPVELTTILAQSSTVRIERIVSTGQVSDWYDQDETEFVALLGGNAEIKFESNEVVSLSKGDTLLINPHEKHRVRAIHRRNRRACGCVCFGDRSEQHEDTD